MGAYSSRVIADGASYYWRLGEPSGTTAVDAVGGANGTISGGVTLGAAGAIGDGNKAMGFDGVTATGKILTASGPRLVVPCTFEVWYNTALSSTPPSSIFTTPPGGNMVTIAKYPSVHQCWVNGNLCRPSPILVGPDDGQWHHLVWVFSGGPAIQMYLDSVAYAVSPQLPAGFTATDLGTCEIGYTATWGPALSWNGALDDIAIYPRALTAPEIAAHYTLAKQSISWPGVPWWTQVGGGDDALDAFNVWEPITPSNTVNLPRGVTGGIWVGAGGDVAAVMQNNVMPVVLAAVPTGAWLPIAATRINATGTTATGLVALYEV